jgi:Rab5 GDP/GTP exchange factor
MGAVQFIENLDRTSLTISDEDFEKNVEAAVSAIAERHSAEEQREQLHLRHPSPRPNRVPEKSTPSRPEITPRNSLEAERATPARRPAGTRVPGSGPESDGEDNAAVAGLLRTIQKPLSTIGRIFSEDNQPQTGDSLAATPRPNNPATTPQPGSTPQRMSPAPPQGYPGQQQQQRRSGEQGRPMSAEDAAARQASAEAEEARRIQRQEHTVVVETLQGMFPNLDREVIDDVVRQKEGR